MFVIETFVGGVLLRSNTEDAVQQVRQTLIMNAKSLTAGIDQQKGSEDSNPGDLWGDGAP
jgi:hypothetical protein